MKTISIKNLYKKGNEFLADVEWDKFIGEYIPTTVQPQMKGYLGDLYQEILTGEWGEPTTYVEDVIPKTVEQKISEIETNVQTHLNTSAKSLGYDNIQTAVSYADEPSVPKFQTEGQALRSWRSLVWAKCYEILATWEAGTITEPTAEEVIAQLPALVI